MNRLPILAALGALALVAVIAGFQVGNNPPSAPQAQGFEARLVQLGLTEDQLEDTLVRGVEAFIARQEQAREQALRDRQEAAASSVPAVSGERDFVRGPLDARFSLIEYSDYECPFCKRFHATARDFFEQQPNLNWAYRHFPLSSHEPQATRAAIIAECTGDALGAEAYWAFNDQYFAATRSGGRGMAGETARGLAERIGVPAATLDACQETPELAERVRESFAEGRSAGVTGTPGIFIRDNETNRVLRVPGAVPLPELQQRFEAFAAG